MKYMAVFSFILLAFVAGAQDFIKKRVVSEEGIPLPFSTIRFLPGSAGIIANEDGFFTISQEKLVSTESLRISHLGYKAVEIKPAQLAQLPIVTLKQELNELSEVNVLADTDKRWAEIIFEAFQKRRNSSMSQSVKGKLTVRSYLKDEPIEILEGEGTVKIDDTGVPEEWRFSYVQTNIDTTGTLQFFNVHTSTLISRFAPFERSEVSAWPLHPGRLGKRSIYKDFKIDLTKYNHETGISEFKLTSKVPEFLSALIWLDEDENTILRYEVFGEDLGDLPIESIIKGKSIEDFEMRLTFDFGSDSNRLNYLLWNYSFDYGSGRRINTLVKMPLENGSVDLPVFIHDKPYHDYALAAILPKPAEGITKERALSRSVLDIKALETLEKGGSSLNVGLIFWERDKPLNTNRIPENNNYRRNSFESSGRPARTAGANAKYELAFNSVIFKTADDVYGDRSFFDSANSAIPRIEDREIGLLVNLLFDEYQFAAQRISTSATSENLAEVIGSERMELDLRKDRLLMNSTGGSDLRYLLERNFANYELYGIDRFYQLNRRIFDSYLFDSMNPHINPSSKEDLALAYLITGDYDKSLKVLKSIPEKSAAQLFLEGLNYYFKGMCEEFKRLMTLAEADGFTIPKQVEAFCP
ncbi:MAG TPA: hypothetical protein VJ949_10030 [Cryomorphaceae bacterium]|nr:hypothetical protein [Cryomorphaceae bacterium]